MKIIKFLCTLLALLLLCLSAVVFVGCDEDTPPASDEVNSALPPEKVYSLATIHENMGEYTIVRQSSTSSTVKKAVAEMRTTLAEILDCDITIKEDWVNDESEIDANALEILIGDTNRPESAKAKEEMAMSKEYTITQEGNKICIVGQDDDALCRGIQEFMAVHFGQVSVNYAYHSVKDYGAKGDGSHDDTKAFQKAVEAAEADGRPVYVPAGTYVITETVELPFVTLYGYSSGAWTADTTDLPRIIQKNIDEPLFHVMGGSLSGLDIVVEGVAGEHEEAPAETIRMSRPGARVSDMRISDPYIGIATFREPDGSSSNPGRCFIENIFIINAYENGIYVHGTYDIPTLCNIEVWNPHISGENANTCPAAFKFGKNDDLRAVNLFAFNANVGFLFEESLASYDDDGNEEWGGCWGSFTNCSTDLSSIGVEVGKGHHALTFVGGTYWNHHYGLLVSSSTSDSTRVTMSGCELKTNGASTVEINGGKMVTVTGCNISRFMDGFAAVPVAINGGTGVTLSGNTICCASTAGVEVSEKFKGATVISGNTILSSLASASGVIVNRASSNKNVVIGDNAILTNYKHES